ncbi:uncharacterized protein LOC132248295 [Alligator mississippiensis]|uniref:uncharacterized protein LOC132248295 n=1 Tax=Alligator mississippiensis TaxID=8496 RepID=UPI002877695D|nr:uncharacterized protein LOC132248295 [Alligator mississippiensis]
MSLIYIHPCSEPKQNSTATFGFRTGVTRWALRSWTMTRISAQRTCSGRTGFISLQKAVVDHHGVFTNISISWAGSSHNAHIFCNSTLLALMKSGCFAPGVPDLQLSKVTIPPLLIRDSAYLLLPWFMQLYAGQLDSHQTHFNRCLGCTCMLVECTFGRLKGHCCTLTACFKVVEANILWVVVTDCVLHKICEVCGQFSGNLYFPPQTQTFSHSPTFPPQTQIPTTFQPPHPPPIKHPLPRANCTYCAPCAFLG